MSLLIIRLAIQPLLIDERYLFTDLDINAADAMLNPIMVLQRQKCVRSQE